MKTRAKIFESPILYRSGETFVSSKKRACSANFLFNRWLCAMIAEELWPAIRGRKCIRIMISEKRFPKSKQFKFGSITVTFGKREELLYYKLADFLRLHIGCDTTIYARVVEGRKP